MLIVLTLNQIFLKSGRYFRDSIVFILFHHRVSRSCALPVPRIFPLILQGVSRQKVRFLLLFQGY